VSRVGGLIAKGASLADRNVARAAKYMQVNRVSRTLNRLHGIARTGRRIRSLVRDPTSLGRMPQGFRPSSGMNRLRGIRFQRSPSAAASGSVSRAETLARRIIRHNVGSKQIRRFSDQAYAGVRRNRNSSSAFGRYRFRS